MAARELTDLDQLMLGAARGDQAAFQQFYDQSAPTLLAVLLRMLRDRFQAEDVLQETMVVAWRKAGDFDPKRAAATTWITTIARRRALDVLRSGTRYDNVLREHTLEVGGDLVPLTGSATVSGEESTATAVKLTHCFDELHTDTAGAIQLAYLDGLSFPEIAGSMERSLNTVKSWIRRGVARLRECMQR